jgi:DNA-binding NtrC family response regulator
MFKKHPSWEGGYKDKSEGAPADSFFLTELKYVTKILQPLDELLKKACYMSEKSRGVGHIALKFIQRNKAPVLVRYLMKIRECHTWISDMPYLGLRFEHHLDGKGIDKVMRTGYPERLLWRHVKFIRDNWKDINEDTHRSLMAFDERSRVETFPEFPQDLIDEHLRRHNNDIKNGYKYTGLTRTQLRKPVKDSGAKDNMEAERSEYEKSAYEKSEGGSDGE